MGRRLVYELGEGGWVGGWDVPWVAVGELIDGAAVEFFWVVLFDLLVGHPIAHARKELVEVVPCLEWVGGWVGG